MVDSNNRSDKERRQKPVAEKRKEHFEKKPIKKIKPSPDARKK